MDYKKKYLKYKLKYLNQKYLGGAKDIYKTPSSKIPKGLEQKDRNIRRKAGKEKNKYKTPPLPPWYVIPDMLVQPDPNVGTPMLPIKNTKLEPEPWGSSDEESELNFLQEDPLTTEPNEYTKNFIKKLKQRIKKRGERMREVNKTQ